LEDEEVEPESDVEEDDFNRDELDEGDLECLDELLELEPVICEMLGEDLLALLLLLDECLLLLPLDECLLELELPELDL